MRYYGLGRLRGGYAERPRNYWACRQRPRAIAPADRASSQPRPSLERPRRAATRDQNGFATIVKRMVWSSERGASEAAPRRAGPLARGRKLAARSCCGQPNAARCTPCAANHCCGSLHGRQTARAPARQSFALSSQQTSIAFSSMPSSSSMSARCRLCATCCAT